MNYSEHYLFNPLDRTKSFDISSFVSSYYFEKRPQFEPRPERYDFSQIFLVLEGDGVYTTEQGEYLFSKGMMLYRPAEHTSRYVWSSDRVVFGLISFVCPSEAMKTFEEQPLLLNEEERATLLDVIKTSARICEPCRENEPLLGMRYKPETPPVVLDFIRSSLERFLSMLYCRIKGIDLLVDETQKVNRFLDDSRLVSRVKEYLNEHVGEQIALNHLCAHFGVSQTALTKKFRTETKQGVIEYFNDLKIADAKQRIKKGNASFTEISDALGFSSVNYFSKVFKEKTGMTPTEYSKYVSKRRADAAAEVKE